MTDRAAIAYLADVFVLDAHRGRGLGKWLIETVMSHPDLQGLRRFFLGTADAHALYERYGFRPLAEPGRMMEIAAPTTPTRRRLRAPMPGLSREQIERRGHRAARSRTCWLSRGISRTPCGGWSRPASTAPSPRSRTASST